MVNELGRSGRLSELLGNLLAMPFRGRARDADMGAAPDSIWAIKDVSFEVQAGQVMGVIGRNGSGKSTLLKILARITTPTEGIAILGGSVGALLEVGTGFHPDLSGRENLPPLVGCSGEPRAKRPSGASAPLVVSWLFQSRASAV